MAAVEGIVHPQVEIFGHLRMYLLLMEEILHQLIGTVRSLSHYLQGFIQPRWCRISSINCRYPECCDHPLWSLFWFEHATTDKPWETCELLLWSSVRFHRLVFIVTVNGWNTIYHGIKRFPHGYATSQLVQGFQPATVSHPLMKSRQPASVLQSLLRSMSPRRQRMKFQKLYLLAAATILQRKGA